MFFRIPDPTFFHPGSRTPDPNFFYLGSGSRIRIKEFKYCNPKKWFLISRKYDQGCSFRIPDLDPDFLSNPDPGSRGRKGTGSRIRIRNTIRNQSSNSVELMPAVLKSLTIRAQALSPFTQTYVL